MLIVSRRIRIPLSEFRLTFARSSGPGGQNVNKVNTKTVLHWTVSISPSVPEPVRERFIRKYQRRITKEGAVVISSQRYRERGRNVADCLAKLREMIASVSTPPKARKATQPTRAARAKRRRQKETLAQKKRRRRAPSERD